MAGFVFGDEFDDEWDILSEPCTPGLLETESPELVLPALPAPAAPARSAQGFIDFTNANPTTAHAIAAFSATLSANGFAELAEQTTWPLLAPGKYYTTRNGTALCAFALGDSWTPEHGAGVVGCHVDALAAKVKPVSLTASVDGYERLGVAPYSGALSKVWRDRDLGLGGRIFVKNPSGTVSSVLVQSSGPVASIPLLAEHFGAPAEKPYNLETQMVPVVGFGDTLLSEATTPATSAEKSAPLYGKHSLKLLRYVARLAKVPVESILLWDLELYSTQAAVVGGLESEFVFAPRVDDRLCSFAALEGLVELGVHAGQLHAVVLYDNEEIGLRTRQGAQGGLLQLCIERVLAARFPDQQLQVLVRTVFANLIILSADVTHLLNPNFADAYLEHHKPLPNVGVTVKQDSNGHVTTDAVGLALLTEVARRNGDTLQLFHIRNDGRLGGTIGPMVSSATGARTIDVGIPQLSMHSIRAVFGAHDVGLGISFFRGFFTHWRNVYDLYGDL